MKHEIYNRTGKGFWQKKEGVSTVTGADGQ
jgi:hypothetical protein